jgi:DNA-3-methyladenine glycosylase
MVTSPFNSQTVLPLEFFQHDDVLGISAALLGKYLCTRIDGNYTTGMIVETEAYRAPEDKASHAYNNKRTSRTEIMFKPGGIAYVYLCYGIHHLFNVVTGGLDRAHAVLIRAIEPVEGIDIMLQRRRLSEISFRLTSGPGSMSKALGIKTDFNGVDLTKSSSSIWIEDCGNKGRMPEIVRSPRIGVDYAEECADWNWRFYIKDNPWISKG